MIWEKFKEVGHCSALMLAGRGDNSDRAFYFLSKIQEEWGEAKTDK